ncbi:MAG: class II glutamine amidotransferase [Alphaproteobacteria bacterium]|nr:class II glutamine amidotransferase [Alphaproteobacteria bacterium]
MCRWLAYSGAPVYLDTLLFRPSNSLIRQSLAAKRSIVPTNGDGFGVGWYGTRIQPGLFRDVLPAWNDDNLRNLAQQIQAGLFFAHVRASTGTATTRHNCHPFRHGRWLFMHNGVIGEYERIRRDLDYLIAPELYSQRAGTTDTEAMFLLALTFGLDHQPAAALRQMVETVRDLMQRNGAERPLRLSVATTDGETLYGVRYSSDTQSPTLYYTIGGAGHPDDPDGYAIAPGAVLVLSEPLDDVTERWIEVPEGQLLTVREGHVALADFVV